MSTDREKARSTMNVMLIVVAVVFVLIGTAVFWGSCHDSGADTTDEMVSPTPNGPGANGAPGVEQ